MQYFLHFNIIVLEQVIQVFKCEKCEKEHALLMFAIIVNLVIFVFQ